MAKRKRSRENKSSTGIRKPELLVPAGGERQFTAAVENGADAVYIGGRAFNARAGADNFDDETMRKAVDYAHTRGVLVFVTMNTLLDDSELGEALEYARFLYETGVDALIIQDLGLGELISQEMPDFPLHLSTQATCCTPADAQAAAELGYERVVLARELSLDEIGAICREGGCDVEIFVHGAICVCYSGQCQMSRYYGGRSGNRGRCAQPCRLPYESFAADGSRIPRAGTHPLSPRDMCLIDHLGSLIDAGVLSFKIEGRMKSPEYVAVVTRIYRKYIDEYMRNGSYTVSAEDRLSLLQIFNRGSFTDAYLRGESGDGLMSGTIPKNQGVLVGRVSRTHAGSELIDVILSGSLEIGDGVEFRPEKGFRTSDSRTPGGIVTYIKETGAHTIRIGDFRGKISDGDLVWRTSSKKQLEEARRSFGTLDEMDDPEKRRPVRRLPVDMTVLQKDGTIRLTASVVRSKDDRRWPSLAKASASAAAGPFAAVPGRGTPAERFEASLHKTGSTPFEVRRIKIIGDLGENGPAVKMSEINALRRECLGALEQKLIFRRSAPERASAPRTAAAPETQTRPAAPETQTRSEDPENFELYFYNIDDLSRPACTDCLSATSERAARSGLRLVLLVPLADMIFHGTDPDAVEEQTGAVLVPYISNVTRGREEQILQDNMEEALERCRRRGVSAGSLGWLRRLASEGIEVTADFGLNAYNSEAAGVLKKLGAADVRGSLETASAEQGAVPLMETEHNFEAARITGDRGHDVDVISRGWSSQSLLVPHGASRMSDPDALEADIRSCIGAGKRRLYIASR